MGTKRKTIQKTHNAKSLRKYKTKELREFIKEHKLPIKRTSKLTKTEIIASMLKSQRNGHHTCMSKIPFKGKKLLTEKQLLGLQKGQNIMREKMSKLKNRVHPSQKLDKKGHSLVQITPQIIEEIKDEIRNGTKEEPQTHLEKVKEGGMNEEIKLYQEILNIEDLIEMSNKNIQRDIDYFNELILEKKEELEKQKEEDNELFEEEEVSKDQENFEKDEISTLTVTQLKKICKDNGLKGYSNLKKRGLVNLVYNNKDKIDNLQELIEERRESKL
tara:strand:+ start:743 stop:1561 length:819 start_codon:yes stop_codon:yes gene_type:complete